MSKTGSGGGVCVRIARPREAANVCDSFASSFSRCSFMFIASVKIPNEPGESLECEHRQRSMGQAKARERGTVFSTPIVRSVLQGCAQPMREFSEEQAECSARKDNLSKCVKNGRSSKGGREAARRSARGTTPLHSSAFALTESSNLMRPTSRFFTRRAVAARHYICCSSLITWLIKT